MRISHIQARSFVDGPGERTVLFTQGCPIHCKGCQNKSIWSAEGGHDDTADAIATTLASLSEKHGNVTISGGEPFAQPLELARLVRALRRKSVGHIIVYSGYTWEQINNPLSGHWLACVDVLDHIDILVDGPFIAAQDDPTITYRGSRNQRPIDVAESQRQDRVITLDWDSPEVVVLPSGDLLAPIGTAFEFAEMGELADTRRCGQTR